MERMCWTSRKTCTQALGQGNILSMAVQYCIVVRFFKVKVCPLCFRLQFNFFRPNRLALKHALLSGDAQYFCIPNRGNKTMRKTALFTFCTQQHSPLPVPLVYLLSIRLSMQRHEAQSRAWPDLSLWHNLMSEGNVQTFNSCSPQHSKRTPGKK